MRIVFESQEPITLMSEDNGHALLVDEGEPEEVGTEDQDDGIWVQLGSWAENGNLCPNESHLTIKQLEGKRVRLTLEIIE